MAKLVVLTEGFAGASFELKGDRTTIGRLEDNAFRLAEASVSGHHCEIAVEGAEVRVKDLNSTNGTFINNQPVKEGVLQPGQVLRLGQVELRLDDGTPPPAAKKQHAHTMPIGGVKVDDLEKTGKPVGTPFARKNDKTGKLMLYGFVALGVVIIGLILYSILGV
jgi:predicted component of type VI protein secretion system